MDEFVCEEVDFALRIWDSKMNMGKMVGLRDR